MNRQSQYKTKLRKEVEREVGSEIHSIIKKNVEYVISEIALVGTTQYSKTKYRLAEAYKAKMIKRIRKAIE